MPQFDDVEEGATTTNANDTTPKQEGVTVTKEGGKTITKASSFRGFFNALKGATQ